MYGVRRKATASTQMELKSVIKLHFSGNRLQLLPPRRQCVLAGLPAANLLSYGKLIKLFTFSASFHTLISPRYFSGRVERFSLKENPKTSYTERKNCRQLFISSSIFVRTEIKSQLWKIQLC